MKFEVFLILSLSCLLVNMQSIEIFPRYEKTELKNLTLKCLLPDTRDIVKYLWFSSNNENKNPIETGSDFDQNENGMELTFRHMHPRLSSVYTCGAEFKDGKRIKISQLNIDVGKLKRRRSKRNLDFEEDLKFNPVPTSRNLELEKPDRIHCRANGSTKVYWMKGTDEVLPNGVEDINGTLYFSNVELDHRGIYTCFATNEMSTINASIEVKLMPRFEVAPEENIETVEMQSILLNCMAVGFPKPTIKWHYEGELIKFENDERFQLFENGSLLLNEVRQDDSGEYACLIGNSAGLKSGKSNIVVKLMDSHTSFEDSEGEDRFIFSRAVLMTCLFSIIYISLVVALMWWCRKKRSERNSHELQSKNEIDDTASDVEEGQPLNNHDKTTNTTTSKNSRSKTLNQNEKQKKTSSSPSPSNLLVDHLNLPYERLIEIKKIGYGQFGEVLSGYLMDSDMPQQNFESNGERLDEIVSQKKYKILARSVPKNSEESYTTEFCRQIDLFRTVDSEHVVRLLATSFEKNQYYMVLEHGQELKSYLTSHSNVDDGETITFCTHVARGLEHIAKLKLTHRDIALRNCIINANNNVKLTMVSLCKDTHAKEYYKIKNFSLPLRHVAPEILDNFSFTLSTDVFALGMTIWEILNYGRWIPFENLSNDDLYSKMKSQNIDYKQLIAMENSKVPSEIEDILMKCWSINSSDRPTAHDLCTFFNNFKNT